MQVWLSNETATIVGVWLSNLLYFLAVPEDTGYDKDSLEAELSALLKTDQSAASATGVPLPTTSRQLESTAEEYDLEARLASLTLGTSQRRTRTSEPDQLDPIPGLGVGKSQTSVNRLKQPPLPA